MEQMKSAKYRADGPIRVAVEQPINYADVVHYIKARPDKLVSFVADHLCDDEMRPFARALYEHLAWEGAFGPWRSL